MKYYSTNKQAPIAGFREAAIRGQAPDKGLYFPENIPQLDPSFLENLPVLSPEEIAFRVILPYVGDAIDEASLFRIVSETVNFPLPLVAINDRIAALELFHGPTLAFKDIGARFMSRCLGHFAAHPGSEGGTLSHAVNGRITVLVATSGDTGGAVANGFYEVDGVDVVILYPSGKVSPVQEKQLTTLGKNIRALEVQGTFDDCQQIVKQAFLDKDLQEKLFLTSANSINVARWLPQQFYYFIAYKEWVKDHPGLRPVVSVPSGNFGNICAGILALRSGLPLGRFIAACNANDIVSQYLQTSVLQPRTAVPTLSNAMDVGNPSNFIRILEIVGHDFPELKSLLSSATITDEETLQTIREVYAESGYLLDPHGAVGYRALDQWLQEYPGQKGFFLETAHPVKFPDAVESVTGTAPEIPASLQPLMQREKKSIVVSADFEQVKECLLQGI